MQRKLRVFVCELLGVGVLMGWLFWKYPELVDRYIPWVALLVGWHATWEFIYEPCKVWLGRLTTEMPREVKWIYIAIVVIGLSILYLHWIKEGLTALSVEHQKWELTQHRDKEPNDVAPVVKSSPAPLGTGAKHAKPKAASITPPVQVSPPVVISPSFGNLRDRTTQLCADITTGMPQRAQYVSNAMPEGPNKIHTMIHSLDSWFRWKYLPRVVSLRDEFAQLHIKNADLEQFFDFEAKINDAQEREQQVMIQTGQRWAMPEHLITQYDWGKIVQDLTQMVQELKQST
jgi:hypothetical protein